MPAKFSDQHILEQKKLIIKDVSNVINKYKSLKYSSYKEHGAYSDCKIRTYFGNWTSVLAELGYEPPNKRNISKQDIINDVIKVFNETGDTTRENYIRKGTYSRSPINRIFGGWNNLLKELNLSTNVEKNISRNDVINDFLRVKNEHGNLFSSTVYRKHGKYSQNVIDRIFGSHSNLMEELGFESNRHYTDDEIINDLKRIHAEYNIISQEIIDNECIVSSVTIRSRFGDIKCLLERHGLNSRDYRKMSKLQENSLKICEEILGFDYVLEKTFDWLRYAKTNRCMFVDIFYPKLKLAIEVDGSQHYSKYGFGGNLEIIQDRDCCKEKLLEKNNIHVIRIKYSDSRKKIKEKLTTFLNQK